MKAPRLNFDDKNTVVFWVGLVGTIASILACFTSIPIGLLQSASAAQVILAIGYVLFNLCLLFLVVFILIDRQRLALRHQTTLQTLSAKLKELQRAASHYESYRLVFPQLHDVFHDLRDSLYTILKTPAISATTLKNSVDQLLLGLTERLKHIYDGLTTATCSVCIKLLTVPDQVETKYRDLQSRNKRGNGRNASVKISENTDFDLIYNSDKNLFLCNDLANYPNYRNSHPDWLTHYNATIVWPLRGIKDPHRDRRDLFGFLCVDTLQTNAFSDHNASLWIGAAVADMVYSYMSIISTIRVKEPDSDGRRNQNVSNPH